MTLDRSKRTIGHTKEYLDLVRDIDTACIIKPSLHTIFKMMKKLVHEHANNLCVRDGGNSSNLCMWKCSLKRTSYLLFTIHNSGNHWHRICSLFNRFVRVSLALSFTHRHTHTSQTHLQTHTPHTRKHTRLYSNLYRSVCSALVIWNLQRNFHSIGYISSCLPFIVID